MKPRNQDDVVVLEGRLVAVRNLLLENEYVGRDIGYMPAGVLNGNTRTDAEANRWVQARYVMIPWNLVQDSLDAPYVILDRISAVENSLPAGFVTLYDSGDGLLLLQKLPSS
jgi:hypothetical protein